jgi:hypothetical protein
MPTSQKLLAKRGPSIHDRGADTLSLREAQRRSNLSPMEHRCFVHILTNRHHTVLYTGVTSNLARLSQLDSDFGNFVPARRR